jgi:hypothetical protein
MAASTTTTFASKQSNSVFVYLSDYPTCDGELLYSPDGITFYALVGGSFSGNSTNHTLTFKDPHHHIKGTIIKKDNTITYAGVDYERQPDFKIDFTRVVPLPKKRRAEYFCRIANGHYVYVSASKYNYSFSSFRLFVGSGARMREVPITNVLRAKDGGSTWIKTVEGDFYAPTAIEGHRRRPRATWNEKKLTWLDEKDFDIVETDDSCSVTPNFV